MNPEFRRNLLLEMTPYRLVGMPLLLLLIYGAAGLFDGIDAASAFSTVVIVGLLVIWGTRLAADAVLGEVAGRTWDSQRMSAMGPWSMGWGKLAGSTIFVWYGAALSVPVFLLGPDASLFDLLRLILAGLLTQTLALFASLAMQRLRPERLRFLINQAQITGLAGGVLLWKLLDSDDSTVYWYGLDAGGADFIFYSELAFLGWVSFGIYRLMRAELQFRCWPIGWAGFTLFCAIYIAGFLPLRYEHRHTADVVHALAGVAGGWTVLQLVAAQLIIVGLTWLAAFAEPKGFVRLRRWRDAVRLADPRSILNAMPAWLPGLAMALIAALLILAIAATVEQRSFTELYGSDTPNMADHENWMALFVFDLARKAGESRSVNFPPDATTIGAYTMALFLFLLRDIGIMQFLTMDGRTRRPLNSTLVYFAVLYLLLPAIVGAAGLRAALPVLVPLPTSHPAIAIAPVVLQIFLVAGLIGWRWTRLARAMEERAP